MDIIIPIVGELVVGIVGSLEYRNYSLITDSGTHNRRSDQEAVGVSCCMLVYIICVIQYIVELPLKEM